MNDMLVGILGLAAIAATVISLTRSRMLPAMAFILWPSVLALAMVIGGRCSFADIEAMIKAGFGSTAPTHRRAFCLLDAFLRDHDGRGHV